MAGGGVRLHADNRVEAAKMAAAIIESGEFPLTPLQRDRTHIREEKLYRRLLYECVGSFLLIAARRRAVLRKMDFNIDSSYVIGLLKEQDHRCAVTGLQFEFAFGGRRRKGREPYRPSIDRIDSKLGYVRGNCRVVLVAVNIAMSSWGEGVFLRIAQAAVTRKRTEQKPHLSNAVSK
jgi:hypothetical protein